MNRGRGDDYGVVVSLNNLGIVVWERGECGEAEAYFEKSLGLVGDLKPLGESLRREFVVSVWIILPGSGLARMGWWTTCSGASWGVVLSRRSGSLRVGSRCSTVIRWPLGAGGGGLGAGGEGGEDGRGAGGSARSLVRLDGHFVSEGLHMNRFYLKNTVVSLVCFAGRGRVLEGQDRRRRGWDSRRGWGSASRC